jgi:hypothetical protein
MFMHRPSFKSSRRSPASGRLRPAPTPAPVLAPRPIYHRAIEEAASYTCERLECRRMLTTLTGGGVVDGQLQENTFTYAEASGEPIKIALWGTITAEFIFVSPEGQVVAPVLDPANSTLSTGDDLFAIYVASASPTASISIAQVVNTTTGAVGGLTTSPTAITVNNATTGQQIKALALTGGSGSAYLGARAYLAPADSGEGTIPILSVPLATQEGVRPPTADGTLLAGLVTAPGVSLNRFFFGGVVTGRVDIGGSINTFYAGDILTGDAGGIFVDSEPTEEALQHNFNVEGDIYNLLSDGPIGTDAISTSGQPDYETGFRLSVGGHIGEVKSFAAATGAIDGSIYAENLPTLKGLGVPQTEEFIGGAAPLAQSGGSFFEGNTPSSDGTEGVPSLGDSTTFSDDTIADAQFLGTPFSATLGNNAVQLTGTIDNTTAIAHNIAYFGVALGADQTISATLTTTAVDAGALELGVLPPDAAYDTTTTTDVLATTYDARDLARDENARDENASDANKLISFTSTDAGVYYFAVAFEGDVNFTGAAVPVEGPVDFQLDITGVKNLGIGAIAAPIGIALSNGDGAPSVRVDYGDLGAIITTGTDGNVLSYGSEPITATTGGIRVIQAGSIGELTAGAGTAPNTIGLGPDIFAAGNVGTLRSTDAAGTLLVNDDVDDPNTGKAIGGSYQLVDCAGDFDGSLVANGNIGTIDASTVGSIQYAPTWQVDANSKSGDGTIDLIDVTGGSFGTLSAGGPKIDTGPGGDLRYLHIDPGALIYNDTFFGGDLDEPITYRAGQAVTLTDDSGTPFTITPYRGQTVAGQVGTTTTTTTGDTSIIEGDALTLETYGIEGSGGVSVISVTCTAGAINLTTTTGGTTSTTTTAPTGSTGPTAISVDTSPNGLKGSVEFGTINMVGTGTTIAYGTTTTTSAIGVVTTTTGFTTTGGEADSVLLSGKDPVSVYDLVATQAALTGSGMGTGTLSGMTTVTDSTSGEIVNFAAQGVETLDAATLGTATSHTGAPVSGATVLSNTFPFHDQRTLIQIGDPTDSLAGYASAAGAAETIESSGAIGDILCEGTIGSVLADVGAKKLDGDQGGITGPVYAEGATGNILNINVGDGLGYSGSGNYAITGIFADNYIGTVSDQNGSDIRGDIVASGQGGGLSGDGPYIDDIDLLNGSIVDANIFTTTTVAQAIESTGFAAQTAADTGAYTILTANATNQGNFADAHYAIGTIETRGAGGILGAFLEEGGIQNITVDGFGIIESDFNSVNLAVIGNISAAGYGIRSSEFDGQNSINSIDATGDGKEIKVSSYASDVRQSGAGATVDSFSGQPLDVFDDLDKFLGTSAKSPTRKPATESGVIADSSLTGSFELNSLTAWALVGNVATVDGKLVNTRETSPMSIDFAASIGTIDIASNTDSVALTTGSLKSFDSGDNVVNSTFTVAGEITDFVAGFLNGSSTVNADGPDGYIAYLDTSAGLNANVNAEDGVGEILVGTNLGSTDVVSGNGLDELYVKGSVLKGASVTVTNTLGTLHIRHNLLGGSSIQAGAITTQYIGGVKNGTITIVPPAP